MATTKVSSHDFEELCLRLRKAEKTLEAIRSGAVDAIVASGQKGEPIFTLQGADQSYRILIESINEGALTLTTDGTILYSNRRFADMLGIPLNEITGTHFLDHIPDSDTHFVKRIFNERDLEGSRFNVILKTRKEMEVPAQVSMGLADIDGDQIVTAIITDLTEQVHSRKIEEQRKKLMEANSELESFAYSVSHDLRAPLRAIDGFTRMILKKTDHFDDETKRQFNVIRQNADLMGKLIEDLLAFSRLGRQELCSAGFDMCELLKNTWEELQSANTDRRMALTIHEMPPVWGDPALIKQILVNLLSNAVKFTRTREEALIEAGAYTRDHMTVYYIRDNGVGFDMKYRDKLFNVFQRLHPAGEFEGTGAGLAIVKRIVQRHGGKAWAEGEVDKGACFYFSLPARNE